LIAMNPQPLSPAQAAQAAETLLQGARAEHLDRLDRWHRLQGPLFRELRALRPYARAGVLRQAAGEVRQSAAWRRMRLTVLLLAAAVVGAALLTDPLDAGHAALLCGLLAIAAQARFILAAQARFIQLQRAAVARGVAALRAAGDERLLG
jgi:hypothetical protein